MTVFSGIFMTCCESDIKIQRHATILVHNKLPPSTRHSLAMLSSIKTKIKNDNNKKKPGAKSRYQCLEILSIPISLDVNQICGIS